MAQVDERDLEAKVKEMYRDVAQKPKEEFHFEMGRALAEKLGYPPADLDRVPEPAIDSFAGVGYHFDLAQIKEGDHVLDLGSGSGMDAFFAATRVGSTGQVIGIDMTDEQLKKAETLGDGFDTGAVMFKKGHIEKLPIPDEKADVVVSNGVINLSARKSEVFDEASRVLKPGGGSRYPTSFLKSSCLTESAATLPCGLLV